MAGNNDIFDREGIPSLYETVWSNQWTWDRFLDVAIKTTKDINADGIVDQWGISSDDFSTISSLVASNGGGLVYKNSDGVYVNGYGQAAVQRALQFFSELSFTYKVTSGNQIQSFYKGNAAMAMNTNISTMNAITKTYHLNTTVVPPPMGPDVNGISYNMTTTGYMFAIPVTEDNSIVPALINLCIGMVPASDPSQPDYISEYDYLKIAWAGRINDRDFKKYLEAAYGSYTSGSILNEMGDYVRSNNSILFRTYVTNLIAKDIRNGISIYTAIATYKNVADEMVNFYFNQ